MFVKTTGLRELLRTHFTFKLFLFSVNRKMLVQVRMILKLLFAVDADNLTGPGLNLKSLNLREKKQNKSNVLLS